MSQYKNIFKKINPFTIQNDLSNSPELRQFVYCHVHVEPTRA